MDKGGEGARIKLVIDASVVVKWIIPGEPWEEEAKTLKNEIVLGRVETYAPELIVYEVSSAIYKAIKNKILKAQDGVKALKAISSIGLNLVQISWHDAAEILELATSTGLTVYDSAYLWLSKMLKAKLVTADKELRRRGENIAETILLNEMNHLNRQG